MTRSKRLTLIACILGSAIVFVDGTVVNVALPALRDDLDASLADQQWIVEAYLLTLGSLVLVGGSLGDLYGRRLIFIVGVAGFGATSLICAIAPSPETLIAARALQGVAGALLVPSSLAIITAVFDAEERGAAIGSWTAWTSASIAFGPPLGGALVDASSWRLVFALNVPLVLGCIALTLHSMPASPGRGGRHVDVVGGALCALGLAGPVFALIHQPEVGWGDPAVLLPLFGGVALLGAFLAWERRSPAPMLPLGLFRSRNFAVGNAATLLIYAGLGASMFFVGIFVQQVGDYSALEAGLALVPVTLMLIVLASRFGALSERLGPRWFMVGGPLVAGIGLLLFMRVDARADYLADVFPAVIVFGLGLAATVAPLTTTVLGAVEQSHAGVASGVNNAVARVAGLLAIAVVGALIAARFEAVLDGSGGERDGAEGVLVRGNAQVTDASVSAFRFGMGSSGVLVIVGAALSLGIQNPRRREECVCPASAVAGQSPSTRSVEAPERAAA